MHYKCNLCGPEVYVFERIILESFMRLQGTSLQVSCASATSAAMSAL